MLFASSQSNHYCPWLSAHLASVGFCKGRNVAISPHIPCAADPPSSLLVSMLTLWGRQTVWIRDSSHPQVPLGDPPESIVPAGKGVRRNTENRGVRCRTTRDGYVEPPCLIFLDPSWCQGFHGCLATASNPGDSFVCRCSSDRAVPAAVVCWAVREGQALPPPHPRFLKTQVCCAARTLHRIRNACTACILYTVAQF